MSRAVYESAYYYATKERRKHLLAAASKRYRERHPERVKAAQAAYRKVASAVLSQKTHQRREAKRRAINALKNRPCADCQGWFEPYQMHFDHRDPTAKSFNISTSQYALTRLLEEAKKCDVVCANCHAIRTHRQIESGQFAHMVKRGMPLC